MDKLILAYIVHGVLFFGFFIAGFVSYFVPIAVESVLPLVSIVVVVLTFVLLMLDARDRGLPKVHALWALLGIIGVLIYHLGFVKGGFGEV